MAELIETKRSTVVTEQSVRMMEETVILRLPPSPPPPSPTIPRDLWTNKIEFLLSVIGYVVDLGKKVEGVLRIISPFFHR